MQITVIICCHNSETRLPQCLARLDESLLGVVGISAEVIIVDNASTDNTKTAALRLVTRLSGAGYRVIDEPSPGLMHARIAGIRSATGDVVCFLDDDNWASREYFLAVISAFESKPNIGFFGCSTRLPNDRVFPPAIAPFAKSYAVGDLYPNSRLLACGEVVWGAGFAARRSTLALIAESEFQPILIGRTGAVQLAGDDSELGHALTIAGCRGWYHSEPLIEHAIDVQRMNPQKLQAMYRGFGASSSVLSRYSLYSKGRVNMALEFFPYFYALKLAKHIAISWLRMSLFRKNIKARCLWLFHIESMRFFFTNRDISAVQVNNFRVLSALRAHVRQSATI